MAFRPNPGHETACCGGNIHRFLPNYTIRMWMKDHESGLAAVLYGPSSCNRRRQRADRDHPGDGLPFGETIAFTIKSERAVSFLASPFVS